MAQGFAKVISVESKPLSLPIGETVAYRDGRTGEIYTDLDHATELLGVGFLPEEERVTVTLVRPMNGKFKGQVRRAIIPADMNEIIVIAAKQGDEIAEQFKQDLVLEGMRKLGMVGAIIEDGVLIPVKTDGSRMMDYAIPIGDDLPPEFQEFIG